MAPSAESDFHTIAEMRSPIGRKTVAFAVNYELAMVDRWHSATAEGVGKPSGDASVELVQNSTNPTKTEVAQCLGSEDRAANQQHLRRPSNLENIQPGDIIMNGIKPNEIKGVTIQSPTTDRKRRSGREQKKKQTPMERTRVRYDMEMVPAVRRNRAFLQSIPLRESVMTNSAKKEEQLPLPRRSTRHAATTTTISRLVNESKNSNPKCESCKQTKCKADVPTGEEPFLNGSSVVWVPQRRAEWEDCVTEMTAVCTSASLRRHIATRGQSTSTKPFHAPLSKEYIRDRVDIDDPLNGYQIRHKDGGWLQGFIMWTNFTTWTHYFKWDSTHEMSGIPSMVRRLNEESDTPQLERVDADGSLAAELEIQPRSGDPFGGGVVFDDIAEISLLGGLGCGEYLLRMALEDIQSRKKYKFVVLQATDSSKTFYERYGFVRVGAICRYESQDKPAPTPGLHPDAPIVGYRHWTHANESARSLDLHGGPSYMMCLKLPSGETPEACPHCGLRLGSTTPFLDAMMKLAIATKPKIEQLGGGATPYPKAGRSVIDSTAEFSVGSSGASGVKRRGRPYGSKGRRSSTTGSATLTLQNNASLPTLPFLPILSGSMAEKTPIRPNQKPKSKPSVGSKRNAPSTGRSGTQMTTKKRRLSNQEQPTAPTGMTYNEKQYNSVWLAVSPFEKKAPRRPPSARSGEGGTASANPSKKRRTSVASNEPATPKRSETAVDRTSFLLKQKVTSYPRDRVHYYNKVVRPKKGGKSRVFFVLHYDEPKGTIRIVPMEPRGILSGKRAGRPRYQAIVENAPQNVRTVPSKDYNIVEAYMVMKTPVVAAEAWDVTG